MVETHPKLKVSASLPLVYSVANEEARMKGDHPCAVVAVPPDPGNGGHESAPEGKQEAEGGEGGG